MGFPRDSQRSKIFTAEAKIAAAFPVLDAMQCKTLATHMCLCQPDLRRLHPTPVTIHSASNSCAAILQSGQIRLSTGRPGGPNAVTVAHALAHILTPPRAVHQTARMVNIDPASLTAMKKGQPVSGFDNHEGRAWHSPAFCITYLTLIQWMAEHKEIPANTITDLRAAFKAQNVKTRTVSKEARDSARERWYARQENNLEADLAALRDRLLPGTRCPACLTPSSIYEDSVTDEHGKIWHQRCWESIHG